MKKLSQILVILLLFVTGIATAQSDVYEYATVVTFVPSNGIYAMGISYSNGDFKEVKLDKNEMKPGIGVNEAPVLKYMAQMSKEGWEIVNFTYTGYGQQYLLKRKLK